MIALLALVALAPAPTPASAPIRVALGQYGRWGAFREGAADGHPRACFAVAEPVGAGPGDGASFAVTSWTCAAMPRAAQVHVRLRGRSGGGPALIRIGDRGFPLAGNGVDAWARDARADIAIVAAMRRAEVVLVEATDARGRRRTDRYPLAGAASAIDAAAVGCLGWGPDP